MRLSSRNNKTDLLIRRAARDQARPGTDETVAVALHEEIVERGSGIDHARRL